MESQPGRKNWPQKLVKCKVFGRNGRLESDFRGQLMGKFSIGAPKALTATRFVTFFIFARLRFHWPEKINVVKIERPFAQTESLRQKN